MKIVQEEKLSLERISNADETALFWHYVYMNRKYLLPSKKYLLLSLKTPKNNLEFWHALIQLGPHKLKLMVTGKRTRPDSFKEVTFSILYQSNQRLWIINVIFTGWYKNHFLLEAQIILNQYIYQMMQKEC